MIESEEDYEVDPADRDWVVRATEISDRYAQEERHTLELDDQPAE